MPPRAFPGGFGGFPAGATGGFTRSRQRDPFRDQQLLRLGLVLVQQLMTMEKKPPVTVLLLLVNVLAYLQPAGLGLDFIPSIRQGCLNPSLVLKSWQWWRLLWSPVLHADELHLFYNMSSLLWKGGQLEPRLGSLPFLRLCAELALVSNTLYVALAAALAAHWPLLGRAVMNQCAVGFSGVLFGLKVVLNHNSPGWSEIYGVRLPTKYVCWAELVLAQLLVPGSSFWGHLCGILAGILHVRILSRVGPFAPGHTVAARRGYSSGVYGYGGNYGSGSRGRNGSTGRRGGRNSWGASWPGSVWEAVFGLPAGRGRGSARTYGHGTWGGGASEAY
ncbi:hypothetical protein N2152v2_003410 [Parachlorella kessleri]